jgi:SsrA-binding protein
MNKRQANNKASKGVSRKIIQKNKAAFFHYEILEKLECGICLKGTEIKSIRAGAVSIKSAFVQINNGHTAEVLGLQITPYSHQRNTFLNHDMDRKKRLLLHKKEIKKLYQKQTQKSLTIVVLSIYLKCGIAKLELGVGRGKKLFDKRQQVKERDEQRKMDNIQKSFRKET